MLEIARLIAMDPVLLLLDEPSTGLNQTEVKKEMDLIRRLPDRGMAVLIVEHNMKVIMEICDRIHVLDYGKKIASGTPDGIRNNPKVIESYLGKEQDVAEM